MTKHFIEVDGKQTTVYAHLRSLDRMADRTMIERRLARGWSVGRALSEPRRDPSPDAITPRLRETWELLGQGKCDKEIAHEMGVAIGTVKEQMHKLMTRIGARNRITAALKFHGIEP